MLYRIVQYIYGISRGGKTVFYRSTANYQTRKKANTMTTATAITITVCDMRAANKAGYVASLNGKERNFLSVKSSSGYGTSAKNLTYEISEQAYGLYEICDANYGGRKRRVSYLAVTPHGWEKFDDRQSAETFLKPSSVATPTIAAPTCPGLKATTEQETLEPFDVEIATCKLKDERFLQVSMKSDNAFKLFMPDMKNRVHGREWNDASRTWLIPIDSVMLLREIIEERTIRTNGMRIAMSFQISGKAKEAMAMD